MIKFMEISYKLQDTSHKCSGGVHICLMPIFIDGWWRKPAIKIILTLFTVAIIISGCSSISIQPRKFFILEYKHATENRALVSKEPHNFTVRVVDSEVSGTFNRRQITVRTSENQIMYDFENLWADRLPNSLANLVFQRVNRYNVFNRTIRDYQQPAKYEIVTIVNTLEYLKYANIYGARIDMEFQLRRTSDNLTVFLHTADRTRQIYGDDIEMFVQSINDLLMEETDIFITALEIYIDVIENDDEFINRGVLSSRSFLEQEQNRNFRTELLDGEQINFMGRLFIPFKTDPINEPLFNLEDSSHNLIGSFQKGEDILLQPGKYFIYLGNGTISQQVVEEIEIFPRYKTIVEPDIGWLTINVLDSARNQVDARYELFSLTTAESYGIGYGIEEGIGLQLDTWVLRPGYYKIVLNGMPFNTYQDFATVEVKKGELEQFTIVVDETNNNRLIGAGRMFHEGFTRGTGRFRISILNHLNSNLNSQNDKGKNSFDLSYTVTEQLDTRIIYDSNPFLYTMSNLIEIGVSKEPDTDLRISSDKFDLKNTFVYFFVRNLGLYGRADLNSQMFSENVYSNDYTPYLKIDKDGLETFEETNRLKIENPLYPLVLKQGVGLNYRAINRNRANLNFRLGLGFRQDINYDVFQFDGINDDGIHIYRELDSVYQRGTELSLNGNFQVFRDLNYSTIADLLIPFDPDSSEAFEWENILNLRLFRNISWDYRLNISYNKNIRDYFLYDHSLFLRFTYIFIQ